MTRRLATRDRIIALLARNPHLTGGEIADQLGVSRQRIAKLLEEMGYVYEPGRWTPGSGGSS